MDGAVYSPYEASTCIQRTNNYHACRDERIKENIIATCFYLAPENNPVSMTKKGWDNSNKDVGLAAHREQEGQESSRHMFNY